MNIFEGNRIVIIIHHNPILFMGEEWTEIFNWMKRIIVSIENDRLLIQFLFSHGGQHLLKCSVIHVGYILYQCWANVKVIC